MKGVKKTFFSREEKNTINNNINFFHTPNGGVGREGSRALALARRPPYTDDKGGLKRAKEDRQ